MIGGIAVCRFCVERSVISDIQMDGSYKAKLKRQLIG